MAGSYNLGTAEGTIRINYDGKGSKQAQTDFGKTEASAKKSGASMTEVGNKALLAGGVIAAGFGYAANKAIDFEHQISAIGSVSGATQDQLDAMRKKALQLGADTSFSASEAASAMEELAKAGVSTTAILGGAADATVALAAAGGVDLPTAATIAANAMNQFGLTAQQLPAIVNNIAGAANASAIDVKDLGLSMSQVGAVAHLAGLSFQDTAVAIAELGNAGIKGSDAGTSLKTFLQNLIPTTKQQVNLFDELGITTNGLGNKFFDASGKAKGLADISQVLQTALKGMSKEQQLATLQTLFGSDAIRAAAVLADNGAKGFNDLATAMGKTSAADVAAKRLDNTAGRIEQLKGSIETLAISIGELLLPFIDRLAKILTTAANWFTSLSGGAQKTVVTILLVAAAVLIVVGVVTKVVAAIRIFSAAWELLNASFIASPIGLIITAVILLVVAIYLLWTRSAAFRNFFIGLWNGIWSVMKAIGAWFAGPFANFFIAIWNAVWPVLKGIGDAAVAVWSFIVGGVKFYWNILTGILNFFAPLFAAVFGLVVSIVKTAWAIISAIITVAATIWKATIGVTLQFIWAIILAVIGAIVAYWKWGWGNLMAVITAVWGFIGPYITIAIRAIQIMISQVVGVITAIWGAVWNFFKSIASSSWAFITSVVRAGVNVVISIINGIKAIVDKVRSFFNQLKAAASGGVGSLISFVGGIPGRIIGALGNVAGMLYSSGQRIIQGLINGIRNMAGRVADAVKSVLQSARDLLPFSPAKKGPFSGRGWTLFSGQAIADALATGITDHADNAIKATLSMVQQVNGVATASSPLMNQFSSTGSPVLAAAPRVDVRPQVTVIADLGNGVRQVVKHTIADEPDLVAASNAKGTKYRGFISPGRGDVNAR
jgi:TP901 family phage tail tape measure protein